MAAPVNREDLGRPIRVVVFGGAFFEPAALEFLARLDEHPEVDFVAAICQSRGLQWHHRFRDVLRRRRLLAGPVLGVYGAQAVARFARGPRAAFRLRRRVRRALTRVTAVADLHAPDVLEQVRKLRPDLGLSYGSPLLRPELFEIPAFGTLGIHHGKVPEYRGVKTVFWALYNGETAAGVTIQRVDAGLDTGDVVREGEVAIGGKRYGRVAAAVQELGLGLYLEAVVAVKRGEAAPRPQARGAGPLYRQPGAREILRLWSRQVTGLRGGG